MRMIFLAFMACVAIIAKAQKYDGLALTPPMGWNSWNTFQTNIDEKIVMDMADALVTTGMRDAGYIYLILDDGWMSVERDNAGNLVADPKKFPRGMKVLADYVHSKGLKFGLYSSAGSKTCAGYPGSRGYEFQDARLFASWGIDYLKFDWCYSEELNVREAYTTMSKALHTAGHPVLFSLSELGTSKPWLWAKDIAHLWRTTGNIHNCFDCTENNGNASESGVMKIMEMQSTLNSYAGPGHWNHPGTMEVGNGMTPAEDRAHFVLWCMSAAPLFAGNDLRRMTKETLALLKNRELIAIDQDSLGAQGFIYKETDSLQTWFKPLRNGDWAVCFFNRSSKPRKVDFNWNRVLITDSASKKEFNANKRYYGIRNVLNKKMLGNSNKPLKATVNPHDVVVVRLGRRM
jgi:alpha-galactosidase